MHDALRNFLPELLALSASSPFVENVDTGLHSARTEIFTRMFPRCGIPDAYGDWQGWEDYVSFLYRTGSITEHTQIWWSVRPHLAYPTSRSASATASPTSAEAQSLAALCYALAARCARALRRRRAAADLPHRLLEENLWRATRYGLSGELLDLERGESIPARARIEQLLEWVAPVADEIGAAPFLAVPERNAAERQIERVAGGRRLRGDLRRAGAGGSAGRWLTSVDPEALADELAAFDVDQFLVAAASTLASLAFAKLEGGDLARPGRRSTRWRRSCR